MADIDVERAQSDRARTAMEALRAASLRVHLPDEADYSALASAWNVAVATRPLAVVEAQSAEDVAAAVRIANEYGLPVSVQATGHSPASTFADELLISTTGLRELALHADERRVRVGAGVRWLDVLQAAAEYGLAPLAGSAPDVGVVGYTTGGGMGPIARTHGLASDRVRAFEVVTGDGVLRRVTATDAPELDFALRGGKGCAGIVTAIEFELLPIAHLYGGAIYFDGSDAATVLHAWAEWCLTLPAEATTSVALLRLPPLPMVPPPLAGRLTMAVRFAWVGDGDEGARRFAPMRALAPALIDAVGPMPYSALGMIHADPVDPMPVIEGHALLHELPSAAVEQLVALAGGQSECPHFLVEVRQMGGAIAESASAAVCHRGAAFSLLLVGLGAPPARDAVMAHSARILTGMAPWSTGGGLPNFDYQGTGEWLHRSYSPDVITRLRAVVDAYDPNGIMAAGRLLPSR